MDAPTILIVNVVEIAGGDPHKVKIALRETRKIHDNAYIKTVLELDSKWPMDDTKRRLDNLWSWNNDKFNKNCS